jgi:hypothetical protein
MDNDILGSIAHHNEETAFFLLIQITTLDLGLPILLSGGAKKKRSL